MRYPILALLTQKPAHGYELKHEFDKRFGAIWPPINIGQIYNTLSALERDGLVQSARVPQKGAPSRRVYEVSEQGHVALEEWVKGPSSDATLKEEFIVKLVLGHLAGVVDPMVLVDEQRQRYFEVMRELNALGARRDNDTAAKLLIEAASLYVQALLKWLDICEEQFASPAGDGDSSA